MSAEEREDLWLSFMRAALSSGVYAGEAAVRADMAVDLYRDRFRPEPAEVTEP